MIWRLADDNADDDEMVMMMTMMGRMTMMKLK